MGNSSKWIYIYIYIYEWLCWLFAAWNGHMHPNCWVFMDLPEGKEEAVWGMTRNGLQQFLNFSLLQNTIQKSSFGSLNSNKTAKSYKAVHYCNSSLGNAICWQMLQIFRKIYIKFAYQNLPSFLIYPRIYEIWFPGYTPQTHFNRVSGRFHLMVSLETLKNGTAWVTLIFQMRC